MLCTQFYLQPPCSKTSSYATVLEVNVYAQIAISSGQTTVKCVNSCNSLKLLCLQLQRPLDQCMTSLLLHCSVEDHNMRSHLESRWCFHFKAESFVHVHVCLPNFRQPDERCLVVYVCTFCILLLYGLRPFQIACCPTITFHSHVLLYIISISSGPFLKAMNV